MSRILIVTVTVTVAMATLSACSEDAVVGDIVEPITCQGPSAGEIDGTVVGVSMVPVDALFYDTSDGLGILSMNHDDPSTADSDRLQIVFPCGLAEERRYSIIGRGDNGLPMYCQAGDAVAQSSFWPSGSLNTTAVATDGVIAVDEATDCLAGRFSLEFSGPQSTSDTVSGWFRVTQ